MSNSKGVMVRAILRNEVLTATRLPIENLGVSMARQDGSEPSEAGKEGLFVWKAYCKRGVLPPANDAADRQTKRQTNSDHDKPGSA